jgi:hypothetical protein
MLSRAQRTVCQRDRGQGRQIPAGWDQAPHALESITEHRLVCDRLGARVERRNPHFFERLGPPRRNEAQRIDDSSRLPSRSITTSMFVVGQML